MMKKQVAIYARCSTTDKQDVSKQVDTLKGYCKQRGFEVYKIYTDNMTGSTEDRPAYQSLMNDVKKLKVSGVVVFRFDRWSRSVKTLVSDLELFQSLNIDFISYQENIDSSTPTGKALFVIASCFSEMERSICRERVINSLKVAKERGVKLGRPRVGLDLGRALELQQDGLGYKAIADELGVAKSTLYYGLKSVRKTADTKVA